MERISPEEFERRYGTGAAQQFTSFNKRKPSLFDRVSGVIEQKGQNVRDAIQGEGEFAGQSPIRRGVEATAEAFTAAPAVAMEAAPEPVREVASSVGDMVSAGFKKLTSAIGSIPALQQWVSENPEAAKTIEEIAGTAQAGGEIAGTILSAQGTANTLQAGADVTKAITQKVAANSKDAFGTIRPTADDIATERATKIKQGFEEQNSRLKTADRSFNENTIIRKIGDEQQTITPVDTLAKYEITPLVEKGTLNMGDYKTGNGALGKIKENVRRLDTDIDTKLVNSGQRVPIDELQAKAVEAVMSNPDLKQAGTVSQNVAKIKSRFDDYRMSYGDDIDIAEINNIRKVANRDWNPDTQDTSRIVGDVSRDYIYDVTPDGAIRELLQQQGELLAAKKYLEKINGTKVTGGRIGNYAMRTGGAVIGSTVENAPIVGPALGMLGGEALARVMQQGQFKSMWTELRSLIAKE